jgi:DNA-binding PadR family transcriptional regulator
LFSLIILNPTKDSGDEIKAKISPEIERNLNILARYWSRMGRRVFLDICRKCGGQARRVKYVSRSKGKTYHYLKFIHNNGAVHYWRVGQDENTRASSTSQSNASVLDSIQDILESKMQGKGLTFREIKDLLEQSYGRTVSPATIYRNISKMIKLNLISKRTEGRTVLFERKFGNPGMSGIQVTKRTVGFNFTGQTLSVNEFVDIRNTGVGLVARHMFYIPNGPIDSISAMNIVVFDETSEIPLTKDNISYSTYGQTVIVIRLSKPLRSSEEIRLFCHYLIPSNTSSLRVNCEVEKGKDVLMKRTFLDGVKEAPPNMVRRVRNGLDHTVVEAEFENISRGDTIVISH